MRYTMHTYSILRHCDGESVEMVECGLSESETRKRMAALSELYEQPIINPSCLTTMIVNETSSDGWYNFVELDPV